MSNKGGKTGKLEGVKWDTGVDTMDRGQVKWSGGRYNVQGGRYNSQENGQGRDIMARGVGIISRRWYNGTCIPKYER